MAIVERAQQDREVALQQTVKQMRINRHQIIPTYVCTVGFSLLLMYILPQFVRNSKNVAAFKSNAKKHLLERL